MAMCCTVLMLNTYLKGATIFCDHSGIWNQMMIDKFTTDIKRTHLALLHNALHFPFCYFVHPQRSCKLGEWRSPAKNGRGTPFPRVLPQFNHCKLRLLPTCNFLCVARCLAINCTFYCYRN